MEMSLDIQPVTVVQPGEERLQSVRCFFSRKEVP